MITTAKRIALFPKSKRERHYRRDSCWSSRPLSFPGSRIHSPASNPHCPQVPNVDFGTLPGTWAVFSAARLYLEFTPTAARGSECWLERLNAPQGFSNTHYGLVAENDIENSYKQNDAVPIIGATLQLTSPQYQMMGTDRSGKERRRHDHRHQSQQPQKPATHHAMPPKIVSQSSYILAYRMLSLKSSNLDAWNRATAGTGHGTAWLDRSTGRAASRGWRCIRANHRCSLRLLVRACHRRLMRFAF